MTLSLKTLITRALSGIVFVVLLIGSLFWNYYSFSIFFFLIAFLGLKEFYNLVDKLNVKTFKITGYFCGVLTYLAFINISFFFKINSEYINKLPLFLLFIPFIIFIVAILSKHQNPLESTLYTLMGILYSVLPFALMHKLVFDANQLQYNPNFLLIIILLIWSNDTFAYLGGTFIGKHKMIERVSPGKTWEGTLFGIFITIALCFYFHKNIQETTSLSWIFLSFLIPILATVGDLVESMIKRIANVKDTGNIMPGHGGILDRFDSILFVVPFIVIIIKIFVQ